MSKVPVARSSSRCSWVQRLSVLRWLLVAAFLTLSPSASASDPASAKNVLVLQSFSVRTVNSDFVKSELRAHSPWPINFYVEYLETKRFNDEVYKEGVFQALLHTYAGLKLDLVVVQAYPALEFAVNHRDQLFPGVPIVFWGVDPTRIAHGKLWPGVTGVTEDAGAQGTVDLALRLHPRTDTVAVITGNSEFETYWLRIVHAELLRSQRVKEIDLVGLPQDQLLEKVAELPPQTIILFQRVPQDSVQPAIAARGLVDWIGQRLPTYCIFTVQCLNDGGIGGVSVKTQEEGRLTAEIALRLLSGERAESIPVVNDGVTYPMVDWRSPPLENPRVRFAARHAGPVPRADSVGARPEVFPCGHYRSSHSDLVDPWIAVAKSPKAKSSGRAP